jgi:hypothetical protein
VSAWVGWPRGRVPRCCGKDMTRAGGVTARAADPPCEVESVQYDCGRCGSRTAVPLRHRLLTAEARKAVAG